MKTPATGPTPAAGSPTTGTAAAEAGLSPALDRTPPEELEAEQAVLGCMMLDPTGEAVTACLELLAGDDFLRKAHGAIYETILRLSLAGEPVDVLTVAAELDRAGLLDYAGGRPYLLACQAAAPVTARAAAYARRVQEAAGKRGVIEAAGKLQAAAFNGVPLETLERQAAGIAALVGKRRGGYRPDIRSGPEVMALDLPPARWAVPGMVPEGLTLLVGGTKLGKSMLSYQLALGIAAGGMALGKVPVEQGTVLYLALEDTWRRVQARLGMFSEGTSIPADIYVAREWRPPAEGGLGDIDRFLDEHPRTRLVIVDTFAALRGVPNSRANVYYLETAEIRAFKALADKHRASILVVHHTNKTKPDDWSDQTSGSTGLPGGADGTIHLSRKRGEQTAILRRTGRELDRDSDLAIVWDEHAGWTYQGEADEYLLSQAQRRLLGAFAERGWQPTAARDLALLLDCSEVATRKALYRMSVTGWVACTLAGGSSLWYVTPSGIEAGSRIVSHTSRTSNTSVLVPGVRDVLEKPSYWDTQGAARSDRPDVRDE